MLLVITSACFLIPAFRGWKRKKRLLPIVNATTAIVSMNYWRKPEDGLRRKIDFIVAKSNFVLHHFFIDPRFFPLDGIIGLCWSMSKKGGKNWEIWHALFHTSVFSGMLLAS